MATFAGRVLRAVGIAICVIAILSFLMFALNRTSTASGHQQEELSGQPAGQQAGQAGGQSGGQANGQANSQPSSGASAEKHESSFHKTVDEISERASAPVSGLSKSEWGEHALRLLFALLVFGFVVGYIARIIRVRV